MMPLREAGKQKEEPSLHKEQRVEMLLQGLRLELHHGMLSLLGPKRELSIIRGALGSRALGPENEPWRLRSRPASQSSGSATEGSCERGRGQEIKVSPRP